MKFGGSFVSFLDYILAGFGAYEKKEEELPKASATKNKVFTQKTEKQRSKQRATPLGLAKNQLAIFCPTTMNEVIEVAEFLRTNQPSMLNISMMDKNLAQRSMDFILGAITAVEATMECVGNGLYLFAPKGTKMIYKAKEEYEY